MPKKVEKLEKAEKEVFGYELLLDCYDCDPEFVDSLDHCYHFLSAIVDFIGMKKQAPPSIFRTDRKEFPEKTGLSGWVPLADSSIVIHTLTKNSFVSIDVYSCRKYDPEKVAEFTNKFFKPRKIDKQFILRGKHYFEENANK